MSRSGYSDEHDEQELNLWRGAVASAIRGKRGQALLREMAAALDAMPEKELITGALESEGGYCALGVVGKSRGLSMADIDPEEYEAVAEAFGIAEELAREIMWQNDECAGKYWSPLPSARGQNTAAKRWSAMRHWVKERIKT